MKNFFKFFIGNDNSSPNFRNLFEASNLCYFAVFNSGLINEVNDKSCQLIGLPKEKIEGRRITDFIPQSDHQSYYHECEKCTQTPSHNAFFINIINSKKETIPVKLSCTKKYKQNENIIFFVLEDISELKSVEHQLQITKDEAEKSKQANLSKSEFLANMSHELRTPMHGILSFSSYGLEDCAEASKEKLKDHFQEIKDSGNRLLNLLNDLLDLAKLEAGKMAYQYEENDLVSVVDIVFSELSLLAGNKNIKFNMETDEEQYFANFDQHKIMQVVRNLLSNAIKFSKKESEIKVEIYKKDIKEHNYLEVRVTDNGIGIPENEIQLIFNKYIQSSNTKPSLGGTGLGLPICQKIIEDHHGHIWAESIPDDKTCFYFNIPLVLPRKIILIVDDDQVSRLHVAKLVEEYGYEAIKAENAKQALKIFSEEKISGVLTDVCMPDMDGIELARIIKSKNKDLNIAFISCTYDHPISNEMMLELGIVEFIEKPINNSKLKSFLKNIF